MAEYENLGPGWDVAARRDYNYSMLLDKETWEGYNSPGKVLHTEEGRPRNVECIDQRFRWW